MIMRQNNIHSHRFAKNLLTQFFLISFLFLIHSKSISQTSFFDKKPIQFRNFTTYNGLSENNVLDIFHDSHDFIWVATVHGLNRFDGYQFKTYLNSAEDSNTISSNYITDIDEDLDGNLWIATDNGLNLYDRKKDVFVKVFHHPTNTNSLSDNNIRKIHCSKNHIVWIETTDGHLHKFNSMSNEFERYKHIAIYQYYYPNHAIFETDSGLWLGGRNFAPTFFNFKDNSFKQLPYSRLQKDSKRESDVAAFYYDSHQRFWITGVDGAYILKGKDIFYKILPVSTFGIIEDQNQNLWFGTGDGLFIFSKDLNLIFHQKKQLNNSSIIGNHINCITKDRNGGIWIGTRDGISYYNSKNQNITHFYSESNNSNSLSENYITALIEDRINQNIWIGTRNAGLNRLDLNTMEIVKLPFNNVSNEHIKTLQLDNKNNLWVGYWSGLGFSKYNLITQTSKRYVFSSINRHADWYNQFHFQTDDSLWIALWGADGLMLFDTKTERFIPFQKDLKIELNNQTINEITKVDPNIYLLRDENGNILKADLSNMDLKRWIDLKNLNHNYFLTNELKKDNYLNEFTPWQKNIIETDRLNQNKIIYRTEEGIFLKNISTGSYSTIYNQPISAFCPIPQNESVMIIDGENQLRYFDCRFNKVIEVTENYRLPKVNSQNARLAVYKNNLMVLEEKEAKEYEFLHIQKGKFSLIRSIPLPNRIKQIVVSDNSLLLLLSDLSILKIGEKVQRILIPKNPPITLSNLINDNCLFSDGEQIYDLNINTLKYIKINFTTQFPISGAEDLKIKVIYNIHEGAALLGTNKGPFILFKSINQIHPFRFNYHDYAGFPVHLATSLVQIKNSLWVGTTKTGLKHYNLKTKTIQSFESNILDSNALWGNTINCLAFDGKDKLWVGATGLNLLDLRTMKFHHYTIDNGLPSNEIRSITLGSKNRIWVTTSKGICYFDSRFQRFQTITLHPKVAYGNFTGATIQLQDGRIATGTNAGLFIFHPDSLLKTKTTPTVHITEINIDNQKFGTDNREKTKLNIPWDNRTVSFQFASINHIYDENLTYEYRLTGFNSRWKTAIGDNRIATYTNLKPGHYTFEVRLKSNERTRITKFDFWIETPFWKKWWFILLSLIILISPLFVVIYLQMSKVNQQKIALRLEQQLLRSQMNPHFIFNSLGSIQNYILNHNPIEASVYLAKFSELMRQILTNSGTEKVSLETEISTLSNYLKLQELRFENKFRYHLYIDPELNTKNVIVPPMLAQPFIENSIEHGFKNSEYQGFIEVKILKQDHQLHYSITDNGIGINNSLKSKQAHTRHKSLAIEITKKRLESFTKLTKKTHKIDIRDLSETTENTTGTQVIIALPLE